MPKMSFSSSGYRSHAAEASGMYLALPVPGDRERLVQRGAYRELMTHDGTKTYLVHSTTPEKAKQILQEGVRALGTQDNPNLESTVVMLAGPDDRNQVAKNAFNLAYQYEGGDADAAERTAKVVFEIPKPTPDIGIGRETFKDTHLAEADGTNIVNLGRVDHPEGPDDTLYEIPAARAVGFIDLSTNDLAWNANPNFQPQSPHNTVQAVGSVALKA